MADPATNIHKLNCVLTSGGHNAGIVNETGHPRRFYQTRRRRADERYVDPDTWQTQTPVQQGSWWLEWESWLVQHSTRKVEPGAPEKGCGIRRDAPGFYVRQP